MDTLLHPNTKFVLKEAVHEVDVNIIQHKLDTCRGLLASCNHLLISGLPGSGKTVLASILATEFANRGATVFFWKEQLDKERNKASLNKHWHKFKNAHVVVYIGATNSLPLEFSFNQIVIITSLYVYPNIMTVRMRPVKSSSRDHCGLISLLLNKRIEPADKYEVRRNTIMDRISLECILLNDIRPDVFYVLCLIIALGIKSCNDYLVCQSLKAVPTAIRVLLNLSLITYDPNDKTVTVYNAVSTCLTERSPEMFAYGLIQVIRNLIDANLNFNNDRIAAAANSLFKTLRLIHVELSKTDIIYKTDFGIFATDVATLMVKHLCYAPFSITNMAEMVQMVATWFKWVNMTPTILNCLMDWLNEMNDPDSIVLPDPIEGIYAYLELRRCMIGSIPTGNMTASLNKAVAILEIWHNHSYTSLMSTYFMLELAKLCNDYNTSSCEKFRSRLHRMLEHCNNVCDLELLLLFFNTHVEPCFKVIALRLKCKITDLLHKQNLHTSHYLRIKRMSTEISNIYSRATP